MGQSTSAGKDTLSTPHFDLSGMDQTNIKKYKPQTIAKHNTAANCWVLFGVYIFDVTNFLNEHPPGAHLILAYAGKDITEVFEENNHSQYARSLLRDMFVGMVDENGEEEEEQIVVEKKEEEKQIVVEKKEEEEIVVEKKEEQIVVEKKEQATEEVNTEVTTATTEEANTEVTTKTEVKSETVETDNTLPTLKVFYGTQKGTARNYANRIVQETIKRKIVSHASAVDLSKYEPEDFANEKAICIFCVSTYTDGTPTDNAAFFYTWLSESCIDFRVTSGFLSKIHFAVFGLGSSIYDEHFNVIGKKIDELLQVGGGKRILQMGVGDQNCERQHGTQEEDFVMWMNMLLTILPSVNLNPVEESCACCKTDATTSCCKDTGAKEETGGCCQSSGDNGTENIGCCKNDDNVVEVEADSDYESEEEAHVEEDEALLDVEDLGVFKAPQKTVTGKREMVTPEIRQSLTKQGYRVLGSHSGVKLCRWNKAMLRGRGGCYKHTFYGIKSYCCMEMTPSLACANKCIFCWRHHSNPVGKEWKWVVDEPEFLIEQAIKNHLDMIKQMKGVPGVKKECFEEAQTVKHCALSLVGEPIMYPHINRFVSMLHERDISSFMVTNCQFPECIRDLKPVTQLYVSVDAATPESLKAVDRPLFKDFWERFNRALEYVTLRQERTVYRLTLVKSYNMEEVANYASLILRGRPDFIEIKGVTFCGNNDASNMTMANVPYHTEVIAFASQILSYCGEEYALASEHAHSCCLLIANKKFLKNNKWHTWIDYPKFFELVRSGQPFSSLDYTAETPDWAVYGHEAAGFDPEQERVYVKGVKKRELKEAMSQIGDNDAENEDRD